VVAVSFKKLGDFRVLGLFFGVAALCRGDALRSSLLRAAAWTCFVPIVAGTLDALLGVALPDRPGATLWVIYEVGFAALAIWLGRSVAARESDSPSTAAYLRELAAYSAAYYTLWASADAIILGLQWDAGWALRVVPNQLYYGGWVVFAYARFYSSGSSLAASPGESSSPSPAPSSVPSSVPRGSAAVPSNARDHASSSTSTQASRYGSARAGSAARGSPTTPLGTFASSRG